MALDSCQESFDSVRAPRSRSTCCAQDTRIEDVFEIGKKIISA